MTKLFAFILLAIVMAGPAFASGNNLTLAGDTYTTGKFSQGLSGSTSAYQTSIDTSSANLPYTVEAWYQVTSSSGTQVILGQENASARNGIGWYIGMSNGHAQAATTTNGSPVNITTSTTVGDGNWHHFAMVITSTGATLYVDGVNVGSNSAGVATGASIDVGHFESNSSFNATGVIDEVAIWQGAHYSANFTPPASPYVGNETNLIALYHLDGNGTDSQGSVSPATTYTLTGPSSGVVSTTSANFTVSVTGSLASAVTITPSDGSCSSCFSPTSVTLAAETTGTASATFTYTPTTTGTKTISTTNNGSLTNPSSLTYTVSNTTATTYTLTAPSPASGTVSVASGNFTVAATGNLASSIVITPSDGSCLSCFSPTTVTLAAETSGSASGTFTYTPTSTGSKTISATNNGSLTNPSSVTYTSNSAGTTVTYPVTNAAFHFSPINWVGDTGRGGSVYRRSAYPGAYFSFTFTASSSPTATILLGGTGSSTASVFVNGTLTDNVSVSGATLAISGLTPSASNTVTVWLRTNGTWGNAGTQVEVTGMQLDSSSTPGTAPTYPKGWIEIVGDSITHGYKTDWVAQTNFVHTYAFMICQSLMQDGYDCGINAITGSGWLVPGNSGNFPAYYVVSGSSGGVGGTYTDASSRWNKVDSGLSALDSNSHLSAYGSTGQEPVGVFICYGTNEANQNTTYDTSDTQAAVNQSITAIRAAAPKAKIGVILPFPLLAGVDYSAAISASYLAAIEAGIAAHSGDPAVGTINVGAPLATYVYSNQSSSFSATSPATAGDTFHPTALGHAMFAPAILDQIKAMYAGAGTSYRYGFH